MGNDLIAVIKQKQAAIAKLQAELEEARALLSGQRPSRMATAAPKFSRTGRVRSRAARAANATRAARAALVGVEGIMPTGSVAKAVDILREAGKPLHITDILRGIETQRGEKVNKATLVGNLSRYIKAKRIFYRAGPNVFGLIEMRKS